METRSLWIIVVPLLAVVILGKFYIRFLRQRFLGQYIREDGPQSHHSKAGTPTAGGVLILLGLLIGLGTAYFVADPSYFTQDLWVTVAITFGLGALGFLDDYQKIAKKHNKGVTGYTKLMIQGALGLGIGLYMLLVLHQTNVTLWNFGSIDFGWFYPVFAMAVVIGTSNALNLTDGLDGLAASTTTISLFTCALIFSSGLVLSTQSAVYPDLAILAFSLIGALTGFLYLNAYPAKIFMGDTGSLALGGALAAMAIIGRFELWLFLIGGIFVIETLSVILQVISFKSTGRRIFKMSPIHHHFELCGWHETKVVTVFLIAQIVFCAAALYLYYNF